MPFIYLLILFLVTACQSKHVNIDVPIKKEVRESVNIEQDGAPKEPVPIFFEKVRPKALPFSRYGNPESYAVEGHKYKVLRSAHGYKAKGVASWYGTKFHKKRTSSGEHYDMYAMTAAHKTLPLPSYVRVKNLRNGREVVVKVNDRGPFRKDRIIDLSYAAASKLGLLPTGTAPVEVEAIMPQGNRAKQVAHYYVQVGAYSRRDAAQDMRAKIKRLTKAPVGIEVYKRHFVVKVGPFESQYQSAQLKRLLQSKGIKGAFAVLQ